jgi:hypothetical protein
VGIKILYSYYTAFMQLDPQGFILSKGNFIGGTLVAIYFAYWAWVEKKRSFQITRQKR